MFAYRRVLPTVAVLLVLTAAHPVRADDAAVRRGEKIVAFWCATCHSIHGRETDRDRAPTFEQIANRSERSEAEFRSFLDENHFPMTTFRLFDDEKDDVAALLASLRE